METVHLKPAILESINSMDNRLKLSKELNTSDQNIYKLIYRNSEKLTTIRFLIAIAKVLDVKNLEDLISLPQTA